jgi:septum formation protein
MTKPSEPRRTRRTNPRLDPIVLASASPRRSELLARAGVEHEIEAASVDESAVAGETPREMALRLARLKASTVAGRLGRGELRFVLGSDTIVVEGDTVFGKPMDAEDALRLLRRLSGRTHSVITGVAVVDSRDLRVWQCAVESLVTFRAADEAELRRYVATGEPLDKAGAYGIQGEGRHLVANLSGSRTNVIGLPVEETLALLARARSECGPASRLDATRSQPNESTGRTGPSEP